MRNRTGYITSGILADYRDNLNTNVNRVKCGICGAYIEKGDGVKSSGYNGKFVHTACKARKVGYHQGGDSEIIGKTIAENFKVSPEWESMLGNNRDGVLAAMEYMRTMGYSSESDGTVDIEWTGQQYNNMNGMAQVASKLHAFHRNGWIDTEPSNVGTHINISTDFIRNKRWSECEHDIGDIAQKSVDVIVNNPRLSKICFGRSSGTWASDTVYNAYGFIHSSAINCQHTTEAKKADTRIEFRIMKFHSGYMTETENGANYYIAGVQIFKKWCKSLRVYYEKGWSVDRIGDKLAKQLLKDMEKMASEASAEWIEWVTR